MKRELERLARAETGRPEKASPPDTTPRLTEWKKASGQFDRI